MSEKSKSKANKAYLNQNLKNDVVSDSNIESDINIESDFDIESENDNDNNSISTFLQSLQSFTNTATNANNQFANINILYAQEKLVKILNREVIVPKQRWEINRILAILTYH